MSDLNKNYQGSPRRYGLEIEYAGVPLLRSAEIIADITQGKIHSDHKTHFTISSDTYGDFAVELDVELAQKISAKAKQDQRQNPESLSIEGLADMVLPELLESVAPTEIVSPPLEISQVDVVQKIVERLRSAGAHGTQDSIFYAFGYHLNPEIRSTNSADILATLRSFIVLYDWVMMQLNMDLSRRISGYAAPYSKDYAHLILDPSYSPGLTELIDDYLAYNPSRNYALDLLPMFLFLYEDQVLQKTDDSLNKKRPTWHFRMPNSSVSDPDWSIFAAIDVWHMVEKTADDTAILNDLMQNYKKRSPEIFSGIDPEWQKFTAQKLGQINDA